MSTSVTIPDQIEPNGPDVTDKLNEWAATLEPGTTVEGPGPEKPYRTDYEFRLTEPWGQTWRNFARFTELDAGTDGKGGSFTINPTPTERQPYGYADYSKPEPRRREMRHTVIAGGGDLTFERCGLDGAKPDGAGWDVRMEMQHGWELRGVQGALFIDSEVYDVRGDFFKIGRRYASKQSAGTIVEFQGGLLVECGRQGFGITETEGCKLRDVRIRGVGRTCFDVEPNAPNSVVNKVDIQGGEAFDVRNNILAVHGDGRHVQDVFIGGVAVGKVRINAGGGAERRGLAICNLGKMENPKMRSSECPVEISGWDDFIVTGVKQAMQPWRVEKWNMPGVLIKNPGENWLVEGNDFGGAAEYRVDA